MKNLIQEFKKFAIKGNVLDMAVGVIIGGAFSKIVTSLVNDIIMPMISLIMGRVNLASLSLTVDALDRNGTPIQIQFGLFLQNILDFFIVASCVFFAVRVINMFKKKEVEEEKKPEAPPEPSSEEVLLAEIRDILKNERER